MKLTQHFLTQNDCYQAGRTIVPRGIMVHSTGVAQPDVEVFLKSWDRPGVNACVHAFVHTGGVVQTLPWDRRGWHAGTPRAGGTSANNTHISFEICEDGLKDRNYFDLVYREAVELTAYDYGREHRVHILCYYPDDCEALARHTAVMDKRRYDAVYQSCKELEEICPQFKTEEALEFAKDSGTLYKAHVMRVLWQYGLSDGMYNTVYRSLFGLRPVRGKILHTPVYETVDTILNLIQECRGVAVLAHPSVYHSMPLARELIAAGRLDGVEIDHPRNTEEDKAELEQLAAEYGLIVTGGTDYHGMNTNTPHPVGTCTTADEQIARIRALAEARKK